MFDILSSIYETPLWFPVIYRVISGACTPADDRALIAELLDAGTGVVLDVACGTGRFTRFIAGESAFTWGIDVSAGMLQRAQSFADRTGIENVAFARMDASDLRFDRDVFDNVTCCWALHLFPDLRGALTEIHRVLKPGGRFAGATLCNEYILGFPGSQEVLRHAVGARVFDREELQDRLVEAGFSTIRFERRGAALFFSAAG